MTKIFVSYSRRDKATVYEIANELRSHGYEVWTDVTGIPGGATWQYEIEEAIENCDVVIVMWSQAAKRSQWVQNEILFALDLKKKILPFLLAEVRFSISIINLQPINFIGKMEQGIAKFIQAVPLELSESAPPEDEDEESVPQAAPSEGVSLVRFRDRILVGLAEDS